MLFQYAPETYTPNRENPNQNGAYIYPDPNDRRIMNKVAEGPGKFIHPMERRLTYVLRDLLKVQGDKYDKTPTIYASVYGRHAGDGRWVHLAPTEEQFEAFLSEAVRRGGEAPPSSRPWRVE